MAEDAGTIEQLRPAAAFLAELEGPDFDFGYWEPSRHNADGSLSMPYFVLSERALAFLAATPSLIFDWPAWAQTDEGQRLYRDRVALAEATPEQLLKLLTALKRSDRFNEGALAAAWESGLLTAIVRRAAQLVGEHRE